jgi:hypothetical protein
MKNFITGETVGNGAAINVELGWIPDLVIVTDVTDGTSFHMGYPNRMSIPFSSGGTTEVEVGDTIKGATSGATAIVKNVLLYSGTWAGGDAAGFFIVERNGLVGTFTTENVYVDSDTTAGTNDAAVTVQVTHTVDSDTEVASATGNAAITGYVGAAGTNSKGFTIGSTIAEEAKLLRWAAWRND